MSTTESILSHHLEMFGEQDIEGIMEDFADDAVLITQTETFRGHEEIRGLFEDLFPEFADPATTFSLDNQEVEGDYAYIVWHAETPDTEYEFATDTFVVRNGEIVAQILAAQTTTKN